MIFDSSYQISLIFDSCYQISKIFDSCYQISKIYIHIHTYIHTYILLYTLLFDSDVNILILYVKYYIYICKCKNEVPKVTSLISMLKKESSVNSYCAINNNKYKMFLDNWGKIINSL